MKKYIAVNANGAELPWDEVKYLPIVEESIEGLYLAGTTIVCELKPEYFQEHRREHVWSKDGTCRRLCFNDPETVAVHEWKEVTDV